MTKRSGSVVSASVVIDKESSGGDFQVQILGISRISILPVNGVLGSGTIPDASVPIGTSTQSVALSAQVLFRRSYALVVTRPGGGLANLGERNDNACPGGEFFSTVQNGAWLIGDPGFDLVFQISVEPVNQFSFKEVFRRKIALIVPGPGTFTARDARPHRKRTGKRAPKLLKTAEVSFSGGSSGGGGIAFVPMKLTRSGRIAGNENHRAKARVLVTYTPTGGQPNTIQVGVPLRVAPR